MIEALLALLKALAPTVLAATQHVIEAMLDGDEEKKTQAIRHLEAEAVRASLHLPLRGGK